MKSSVHLFVSFILAILFYPVYKFNVVWIIIGGVLIDIDHYIWYVLKFKKFGLRECYNYCAYGTIRDNWKYVTGSLFIFHNLEFLILVSILSYYFTEALMFTIGLLSHYMLDFVWHFYAVKKQTHAISILEWLRRRLSRIQKI